MAVDPAETLGTGRRLFELKSHKTEYAIGLYS